MSAAPVPVSPSVAPPPVHASVRLWLAAIAAGAVEALVWLLLPEPPTLAQLGVRFAIYTGLTVLVLALYTGRNAVRWAVAALLGGIGTLSLVVEPVSWLAAGGDPVAFLTAADGPTLVVSALRVLHIAAVLTALTLMFRPESARFFRRR
ncbi:hypothetical protein GCM10009609_71960 [Pseudonocardia aurantiaca]|uniref:DUF4149 domain-containing protein n=1 Tax=Pseudonocardia aurantiaca TaxID=75290 RepID=A0ABW4FLA6_9PSEU